MRVVNATILELFDQAPERRPTAPAVNRKFARFIRDLLEAEEEPI